MALVHSIISLETNLVLTREIGGKTTAEELLQTHRDVLDHPNLGKHVRFLVALDTIVEGLVTAEDMASCVPLQQRIKATRGSCQVAMFAPSNLAYGLSRMFRSYVETTGHQYGIFETLDESMAWLEVSDEEATEIRQRLSIPLPDSPSTSEKNSDHSKRASADE